MEIINNDLRKLSTSYVSDVALKYYHSEITSIHIFLSLLRFLKKETESGERNDLLVIREKVKETGEKYGFNAKEFEKKFLELYPQGVAALEGEKFHITYSDETKKIFARLSEEAQSSKIPSDIRDLIRVLVGDPALKVREIWDLTFPNPVDANSYVEALADIFKKEPQVLDFEGHPAMTNLNKLVLRKNPIFIGKDNQIKSIEMALIGKTISNAILVGKAGTGKTSAVREFAKRIVNNSVVEELRNKVVYQMDASILKAGARYYGDIEQRLTDVLMTAKENKNCILFIDEAHVLYEGASNSSSPLDVLKPYLTDGDLKIILATTDVEYGKFLAKDSAFSRRFHRINISESDFGETLQIIKGIQPEYEKFYNKEASSDLAEKVVELSEKYSLDLANPAKSIAMLEVAFTASKVFADRKIVLDDDVLKAISVKYDIKINKERSETIKEKMQLHVLGQEKIIDEVDNILSYIESGLVDKTKPLGSFLFAGPTGVGKTELAKLIAKEFFGNEKFLLKFNMGEYSSLDSITKLTGSGPGFVRSDEEPELTKQINQYPSAVVLFDEIEKAHEDVMKVLLNILDEGEMTDNHGRRSSFRNAIIIFTTNLGFSSSQKAGFMSNDTTKGDVDQAIKGHFKPEFLNRIEAVIQFNALTKDVIKELADRNKIFFADNIKELKEYQFNEKDYESIYKDSNVETYGARGVQRATRKRLKEILKNIKDGGNK